MDMSCTNRCYSTNRLSSNVYISLKHRSRSPEIPLQRQRKKWGQLEQLIVIYMNMLS